MPPARSKPVKTPPATAAHCSPAFEKWMQVNHKPLINDHNW